MGHSIPGRGDMDNFYRYGAEQVSTPNDLNSELPPVQNFAFGGIANPVQRATLRPSDLAYLNKRQEQVDAYERERQAYNTALEKYQSEVYNPYKAQVDAYNAALQKYNTEIYEPYSQKFAEYEKAVNAWNEGPKDTDYSGPAAPEAPQAFSMEAPKDPQEFTMAAPTVPFNVDDVKAYQQSAAERAKRDAAGRAVAIDVVSNPEQFNFGSMSISNRFMAKGGPASVSDLSAINAFNASDEEDETINTNPVGTAQQMLSDLTGAGQDQTGAQEAPTRQTVKRVRATPSSSKGVKGMTLEYESLTKGDLGAMQDFKPKFKETDSARAQLEDLARQYQLKLAAVKNRSRGLAADTFGAPTLEGPTLTKSRLTRRRFAEGGEVKEEPSIFGVTDYAARVAKQMFPEQMGQDDQRDAARHMLAAGIVARKYGPQAAILLGKAHERMSNPKSFFNMLGVGQARYDYDVDMHNNRVGAELAARTKSQAELERLVRAMAEQATTKQTPGRPMVLSREQLEAIDEQNRRAATPPPEYRAKGSPKEGEVAEPTEAELEAASRPAFVTPKSGIGRKQSMTSGQANDAVLQGISELPYNLAGAFVDIPTMVMRPFGYSNPTPFLGSEYLKQKATELGIRPEPPKEPAARALYELGQVGSSLVNPAAATRSVVRGAQRVGQAAGEAARDFQQYNQQLTVPSASYAVRPTGSVTATKLIGGGSELGQIVDKGRREARAAVDAALANAPANSPVPSKTALEDRTALIQKFWDTKAKNYFERQFGTPDDPIADALKQGRIRGPLISEDLERGFPEFLLDALKEGKTRTRVGPTGVEETRFFPKYPEAHEEFTRRYDTGTGLRGMFFTNEPGLVSDKYSGSKSTLGTQRQQELTQRTAEALGAQGVRPELANPKIDLIARSEVNPENVTGSSTSRKMLDTLEPFMTSKALDDMMSPDQLAAITAVRKGEPLYDASFMSGPVAELLNTKSINRYLATLPDRELAKVRFEDVVIGANKLNERAQGFKALDKRIRAGKSVPAKVFEEGVSAPLLQIKEGPLEGFAFKRIEKSEATVPEGAYVGHSVGGYEMGGITYDVTKMKGFKAGDWRVYSLRDNRNRPVTTIEVKMVDENTPVVTQIKGNGRATGNVKPEKYDSAVLQFLKDYLKPAAIEEKDELLTPILQTYKDALGPSPRMK